MAAATPEIRIRSLGSQPVRRDGDYVLYWMTAFRRGTWNFALQRAVQWAADLQRPLLVFEALRCGYPWASDRLHAFVIQGMADNAEWFRRYPAVTYFPYLEQAKGDGKGLLESLAEQACIVVGDDFPCFFLPHMMKAAQRQIPVRFELVDANGLLPLRAADKVFSRAFDFRRFLQKKLTPFLSQLPEPDPLQGVALPKMGKLPKRITERWPVANVAEIARKPELLCEFPIDHRVQVTSTRGGSQAAQACLQSFLESRLPRYADERNQPQVEAASGLSPYLHFGHISVHQVFADLMRQEDWTTAALKQKPDGSSTGWWAASAPVEAFLDELITWREIGYNMCWQRDDYDQYESLPNWAKQTLAEHADDERPELYDLDDFERARTHDPLWNAAQVQLVREGRIHNYLRMLWGKKILEWSASPQDALAIMIELNNKYALDGRNPNSYSGIFWVLGRYDRAWGPERPIFGKIRYMSSDSTARKVRVGNYLKQYAKLDS
jgi:deoxyribodipyrimidine photo-lyase